MSSRLRTVAAGLAAAALATLGLTACAGANQNAESGTGVLTIQGDAGDPTLNENFNPYAGTQLEGTRLIYEPMEVPSAIDGSFTPFLATGHKFSNSTTLTFTLRRGVTWSDGKPFTAADVVFSFDLIKKKAALDTTGVWTQLKSIQAAGNSVILHFKKPSVPFAIVVAALPIVPEHLWSSVKDPVKFTNPKPVGTGPFLLDKFAPTQYEFTKNPAYWQASKIAPKEIKFPAQSTNQSTNQLDITIGKFDWSYNYLPDINSTYLSRDKHNKRWFPPGGTIGLFLNLTKAPYNDANFRKGLSLALDRSSIAAKAVNGYTGPATMAGLILPNLQKFLDPSLPDQGRITQNVPAAMSAFAKAGYTKHGGKLAKNGKSISMTITMPNNFSDWVAAAKEVKSELSKVGLSVNLDEPQFPQYESSIQAGSFDAAIGGFGGSGTPYVDFNNALNSQFATPINKPTTNNFERFKSPTVDKALQTLSSAVGLEAQKKAAYQLEQVMYQQTPIVLLYYGGSWGLFSTRNFVGWPSASDPYSLPTTYNQAMLVIVTHLKRA